jgi:hypothetical protein
MSRGIRLGRDSTSFSGVLVFHATVVCEKGFLDGGTKRNVLSIVVSLNVLPLSEAEGLMPVILIEINLIGIT